MPIVAWIDANITYQFHKHFISLSNENGARDAPSQRVQTLSLCDP